MTLIATSLDEFDKGNDGGTQCVSDFLVDNEYESPHDTALLQGTLKVMKIIFWGGPVLLVRPSQKFFT